MSHLIQHTLPLQGRTLIKLCQKTFIKPNLNKLYRFQTQTDQAKNQQIIDELCFKKLTVRQSTELNKENRKLLSGYRNELRKKKKIKYTNGPEIIKEIFTRDEDRTEQELQLKRKKNHINALQYLGKMPQKIHLHQRYNGIINQKVNILNEIKQIEMTKSNYRNWINNNRNSPTKNPNFARMNFLLDKMPSDRVYILDMKQNANQTTKFLPNFVNITTRSSKPKSHHAIKVSIPNVTLNINTRDQYSPKLNTRWFGKSTVIKSQIKGIDKR